MYNHVQWVGDNHQVSKIIPIFVGPLLPATSDASPLPEMKVVTLRKFEELGRKLVSALQDAATQALPLSLSDEVYNVMKNRDLLYPRVLLSLDMTVLQDIPPR